MPVHISSNLLKHFKGFCSSPEVIMLFVYMKCRFSLSYRELEELAYIRGAVIDHSTLQRWIIKFVPLIDKQVRKRKKTVGSSWRMDETYIKLNGRWNKSGSNKSALNSVNDNLLEDEKITIHQNKYLNNIMEQDHRFIKKRTKPMLGFKNFRSAKITISGIENIRIIQKGQIIGADSHLYAFENFKMLMAS